MAAAHPDLLKVNFDPTFVPPVNNPLVKQLEQETTAAATDR
jgi:hypothetical protein